ncbi:hypothetical protein [Oscillibacter sp.]|uniref:hypothetical protein n=1 Tax=Oscillibacter sp. TaxID=1945593 RepID=UPI0026040273|nr:hypothetical protein [Oscillibacter sp.]MDD3347516.1 hypothetical protein [Oscillibacter sp.]
MKWDITTQERNNLVEAHLGAIWWTINKNRRLISAAGLDDEDVFQQLAIRMIRAFAFMGLWVLFSWLAGAFDPTPERRDPREVSPEDTDARSSRTGREGPDPYGRAKSHR